MSDKLDTRVIQITNVAPGATREQMKTLFGYIGHIDELKLYPPEESEVQVPARVCYVKYDDTTSVGVALHLTNTVFIDRALIVVPVMDGKIPDEQTALQMAPSAIAGMMPGQPTWPSNVMSQLQGTGTNQVITTNDPRLTAHGLPQYPPLPGSTDPAKIEEIRRTVVVGNLDAITTGEHVLTFFSQVGEIKYVKLSEDSDGTRIALVEFSDQRSIASALTYSGVMFQNKPLRVTHSYSSIIKPQNKHQQAAQREIEEAMKKVKEAQSLITAAADMGDINIDKTVSKLANDLHRSRSRSRSKSKKRRSRSHSRHRSRSKSHKSHKSRSRSRQRSKSRRSRSKKRSRSRSKKQRSRSRSKSRSRRNRSRSRSRRRSSLPRRSRSLSRRQRSKSRSRKSPKPEEVTAIKERRRSRSSKRSSRKSRSRSRKRSRSKSKRSGSQEKIKISDSVDKKSISKSLSPPKLEREDSLYEESSSRRSSEDTKTDELSSIKKSSPPVPVVKSSPPVPEVKSSPPVPDVKRSSSKARSRSRSRRISSRRSRSKSGSRHRSRKIPRRSRSRSRKRSRSRRRSRSRSGSRHRSRKDKKRDTERIRGHSRDKDKDKSKRKHKEKEKEKDDKKDSKVTRNYDEEEQTIYDDSAQANSASGRSTGDRNQMESRDGGGTSAVLDTTEDGSNLQQIDMDMSD